MRKKSREGWGKEKSKPHTNQVCSNKSYTESAGPLQFKSFVNRFIKPEFLAKKSNIYEDPQEDEEEKEEQAPKSKHSRQQHSLRPQSVEKSPKKAVKKEDSQAEP